MTLNSNTDLESRQPALLRGTCGPTPGAARWRRCSQRWGARREGASRAPLGRHDAPPDELGGARETKASDVFVEAAAHVNRRAPAPELVARHIAKNNRFELFKTDLFRDALF